MGQSKRRYQPRLGEDAERGMFGGIKDQLRWWTQQEGHHAVAASPAPDLAGVAVDLHRTLAVGGPFRHDRHARRHL
jgi:hypothetical protein